MIAGAIVAGGAAMRLGGKKLLAPFAGGTLLEAVIARVRPQVDVLALNLRAAATAPQELPVLTDAIGGHLGPLAGIVTALEWAASLGNVHWVASFPGDTPFLPPDLVATLRQAAVAGRPVVASDGVRNQNLCALWPLACAAQLREGLLSGRLRSLYRAQEELGAIVCPIAAPAHAFFNVNTPEDLAEARRLVGG